MNKVALWRFPESDFDLWLETCGGADAVAQSYADYTAMLDATIGEVRANGLDVIESNIGVEAMLFALEERGFENTTENRAAILALHAAN